MAQILIESFGDLGPSKNVMGSISGNNFALLPRAAVPSALAALCIGLAAPSQMTGAGQASSDHWAFQPVREVQPPPDKSGWARNPIDRFILARLKEEGLAPNSPADKRVLIRRAYFDLIGLPPTPEQVRAFVEDRSPGAFEKVIEELLASPHYGERWGRHWLDAARYADTSGDGADAPVPEAHLYRDYVIEAFNLDLPYDQFIIEQIAGDLLAKHEAGVRERERTIATGYIAIARRFNNAEYADMHLVIENTVSTIGKGMLGMSVGCARCHDHKFDPISMEDYYGFYGYFSSTQYPHAGTEQGRARKNFVPLPGGGIAWAVTDKKDASEIGDAAVQRRGEPRNRGDQVPRGFLSVLKPSAAQIPEGESGRLQLARWIASPENPLTTRVVVNRIWQHHFERGIVPTADTFGRQGKAPTHPQLLDWLAGEFIRRGWSFKEMHRLIMTSRTWQQSSESSDARMQIDPENRWYWRYPRHRLEVEAMRDAALFAAGRLRLERSGPHPFPKPNEKDEYPYTQHHPFLQDYDHEYRAVYLPVRRLGKHPLMELFNGPDPNECTGRREVSTVPLQALFWMNSDFIRDNARAIAKRLLETGTETEGRIQQAYETIYGRVPSGEETAELSEYLQRYQAGIEDSGGSAERELRAWTSLCRLLLSSNEFAYLD